MRTVTEQYLIRRGVGTRTLAGIRKAFPEEPLDKLFFFVEIATERE